LALKNARDLGFDATFLCLNWCTNRVTIELAGSAAEGLMGSVLYSPPGEGIVGFADADEYLKAKGSSIEEKGLLYGQGWWMMAIFFEGIRATAAAGNELTGENIRAAFESMQDFDTGGVTMPISFSATDHRGMTSMRIYRVEAGSWQQATGFRTAL